jgi:cytidylate kinase
MNRPVDVITISRQYGSGGLEFGMALARHLKYPLFHREILSHLASGMNTSEEVVETYERMRYGASEFFLSSLSKRFSGLEREIIESDRYIAALKTVMERLTTLGRVIIVGRGGQCLLADHPSALHLRIVADMDYRMASLTAKDEYDGWTRRALQRHIKERDEERGEFARKHFKRFIGDPTLYHLTINFSRIPQPQALDLVLSLLD